jgi:hypothetical protein
MFRRKINKLFLCACAIFTVGCNFAQCDEEDSYVRAYTMNILGIFQDPFEFEGSLWG